MVFSRGYLCEKVYSDKNKYISEYELLKEGLIKKYGKPILDKQEWKDDGYKGMKALWGLGVFYRMYSYFNNGCRDCISQ